MFSKSVIYKPFQYPWAVEVAQQHEKIHWTEDEVTLEEDVNDWKRNKLSTCEKEFITQILRLFTQSDVAVGAYYYDKFIPIFRNNEIRNMLGSFAAREAIHQRAYALLNDTLGLPEGDYSAFLGYTEMRDKMEYIGKTEASGTIQDIGHTLAKATFNEGVSLFASFAMLLNFQRRGLMKGMGKVVEWSVRDESLHVEGVSKLFKAFVAENKKVVNDEFKKSIYETATATVAHEDAFIDLAYKDCEIQGLTAEDTKQYIRYLTDRRLIQLGLKGVYKVKKNPIIWIEAILNAPSHDNFFEAKVVNYEVGGLKGEWGYD